MLSLRHLQPSRSHQITRTRSESLSRVPLLGRDDLALAMAYAALKAGKMRMTNQLLEAIRKILSSSLLQPEIGSLLEHKLSNRGKNVVLGRRKVVEALSHLVLEKNDDDQIQRFIWQASQAGIENVDVDAELLDIPLPSTEELKKAGHWLRELFSLLLNSNELRNLVADSLLLFCDLFAAAADGVAAFNSTTKASKKAAREVRPSDEQKKAQEHWDDVLGNAHDVRKQFKRGAEDKRDGLLKKGVKKSRALKEYADEHVPTDAKGSIASRHLHTTAGDLSADVELFRRRKRHGHRGCR
ncbi:hypothetical protein JCM10213v2_004100 [Rhodosporidiobolus nylandii]